MKYYSSKRVSLAFEETIEKVIEELKKEGFGVLTQIDVTKTLKEKIDVDFRKYRILGACNPHFAHKALQEEDKIGTMLPCNVIVQEISPGTIEVAAIDPVASMMAVDNSMLKEVSKEVKSKLERVVNAI